MKNREELSRDSNELRRRAEEIAQSQADGASKPPEDFKPEEIQIVLHELRVHQIELELQNTELRRSQSELNLMLGRYLDLYDLAPVGYMTLSEKGIILETNLTAANLLDFPRAELVKQPFTHFILPADQDSYYYHKKALFETKQTQNCQLRLIRKDGTPFWAILTGAAAEDSDGLVTCRVVMSDITERVHAERALEESEARFHVAQQMSPDGFTILRPVRNEKGETVDFTWVYENQTIARINGTDPEAVIGDRLLDLFPNHRGTPVFEAYRQVADTGKNQVLRDVYVGEILSKPTWLRLVLVSMGEDIAILTQDITERVQTERALRESEAGLREAQRLANIGSWQYDLHSGEVSLSDEMYNIIGLARDGSALEIDSHENHYTPASWQKFKAAVYSARKTGEPYQIELEIIRVNEVNRWAVARGEAIADSRGEVIQLRGTLQDITDRKMIEKSLSESEEKFRILVDQAPVALFLHDIAGQIVDINRKTLENYGYTEDEILELKASDIDVDYIKREDEGAFWDQLNRKGQIDFQARHKRKDSTLFPVNISLSAIEIQDQKFILALAEDITEQVQAERALRESEEKFRTLFETMSEGVVYHDAEGKITAANLAAERILGLSLEQMQGKTSMDPRWKSVDEHGDDLLGEQHPAMVALHTGEKVENFLMSVNISERDEVVWILVNAVPQFKEGSDVPHQVYSTFVDISERVQRAARIERLNRVLRAIRDVNQLITQEKDREALLWRACDILTSTRGYGNAWVALRGEDGRAETVVECGIGEDFAPLRQAMVQGDWPECCQRAWARPESIAVIHAPNRNCQTCSLSDLHRDTAAMAGALRYAGHDFGVLVVALPAEMAGDKDEQSLFRELVDDLAYALHALALEGERKAAEEALRGSEDRFRRAINQAPFPAMIHAEDGEVVLINTSWTQHTGYTYEDIPTVEAWSEKAHGERQGAGREVIDALYDAQGYTDEGVFEITCRDGSTRIWDFRSTLLGPDDTGRRLVLSMAVDLTERVQMESQLQVEKEWSENLINNAPNIVVGLGERSQIAVFNHFAEQLTGYQEEEVIGKEWIGMFVPEELREDIYNVWDEIVDSGSIDHNYENEIITRSGERRLIDWHNTALTEKGVFKMILSLGVDITERVQAEEALRMSEVKYRTLVNSTLQGVVIAQADPVRLVFVNPAMVQISGYSSERLVGMGPDDLVKLIHEEERQQFFSNFQKRLAGESPSPSSEYRLVTKEGTVKWVALYSSQIEYQNEPATLTTFMDITERKRAEDDLRQLKDHLQEEVAQKTRELQERVDILERFHAATITRELRMKELRDEIARLKGEDG